MLRLPSRLELGPFTLHLDVLAARWQRRRGWRIGRTLLLLAALGISGVLLSSYARGTGTVVVPEHDVSVRLTLDGTSIPHSTVTLPSGTYTLRVEQAGNFPVEQTIQVTRGQTTTVTLSLMQPIPLVQPLPPPSAESMWTQVSPDVSGGWRIAAAQPSVEDATRARPGWGPNVPTEERTLFHLDPDGLAPLSVLETYPVADEVMGANNTRFWAVWEAERNAAQSDIVGTLTVNTPIGTRTLSTTVALAGLLTGRRVRVEVGYVELLHGEPAHPSERARLIAEGEERRRNRSTARRIESSMPDTAERAAMQDADTALAMGAVHQDLGADDQLTPLPSVLRPRKPRPTPSPTDELPAEPPT